MDDPEPIHVTVPTPRGEPRDWPQPPDGVIVHHSPSLHPDDVTVVDGIPMTSVSRTLIDLAEVMEADELRECFANARERGLLELLHSDVDFDRLAACTPLRVYE